MPPRIPDETREAILADIRGGGTCRGIAEHHGVSPSTVTKLAKDAGIANAFERAQTKNATEARLADNRARRAELSSRLLKKAGQLLDQMDRPHRVFNFGGKDNTFEERVLDVPPTGDLRNLMVTAATAIDKHVVLEKVDADSGTDTAGSLLGALLDDLIERHGDSPEAG